MNKRTKLNCLIVYSSQRHVPYIDHILNIVQECLVNEGYNPIFLREEIKPGQDYLQQIKRLIRDSILGVVILDGFRPNLIFEFGMLIALNKCILVLKSNEAIITTKSFYTQSEDPKNRDSRLTEAQFSKLAEPYININRHLSDYAGKHIVYYDFTQVKRIRELINSNLKKIEICVKKYIEEKKMEAKKLKDLTTLVQLDLDKVDYLIRDNNFTRALDTIERSRRQYLDSNEQLNSIYLFKKGETLQKMSRFEEAIEVYEKALKLITDKSQLLNIYFNLGQSYLNTPDIGASFSWLETALNIAEEIGKPKSKAMILNKIGELYLKKSNLDQANEYFKKTDKILGRLFNKSKSKSEQFNILEQIKSNKLAQINVLDQYYKEKDSEYEKKKIPKVFISYAIQDSKRLKIPDLVMFLQTRSKEFEISYWHKYEQYDEIFHFMAENIATADLIIIFFSKNALESSGITTELNYSFRMQKQIIPIFEKGVNIPFYWKSRSVLEYDPRRFSSFLKKLYELITSEIEKIKKNKEI